MSSVQVSRFYDSSYEFSFLWGLQPCRVYNLIGETEMTPTKQMTIRERWSWGEALRVKGSVEGSACRAGGKTSQTGYFSACYKELHWLGREQGGGWSRNACVMSPILHSKAIASHVSSHSLTPPLLLMLHSLLQLSGDRDLGFEGLHGCLIDSRGRANWPFHTRVCPVHHALIPVSCSSPLLTLLPRTLLLRVWAKDQCLWLIRNEESPAYNLLNQNLCFNKSPKWVVCTVKSEKAFNNIGFQI